MNLLTLLAVLATPGSGTVFDPTTPPIIVDLPAITVQPIATIQRVRG
jgi:hypothetical protein|tara:strand:- start:1385 stop:1525 length:141 start_codon:yes stop_codon:yes gene_type:complete